MSAEMERAASTDFALGPDPAAHQGYKILAYRQAQPGAIEPAAGGMVRLGERLEDQLLLLRWDADASVAHREQNRESRTENWGHAGGCWFLVLRSHRDGHLTLLGELERVADQVD